MSKRRKLNKHIYTNKNQKRQILQQKFNKFSHSKSYVVRNKYMHIFPFTAINNLITEKVPS